MKLVYKNILINTFVSIVILLLGQYSLYYFLKGKIEKETVEHLYNEYHMVKHQLKNGIDIENYKYNVGDFVEINSIEKIEYTEPIVKNIVLVEDEETDEQEHEGHHEEETFASKTIVFDVIHNNKNYRISILKTTDEDEGLTNSMSLIIFVSGLIMLVILVVVNIFVYYRLFAPVYQLTKDVRNFSIQQLQKILPPETTTSEFITLGEEISKMSEKMISDYTSIKEFNENITHEIQTPLAVINSKIERCIQDEHLTSDQASLLMDASKAVTKLFNINKGLTLLSKLDNKQFNNPIEINIAKLIPQRLHFFSDFIENKNISVVENYKSDVIVFMKESLAEILIDNLIKNAIQHNLPNGKIVITCQKNKVSISNSGMEPLEPTETYFNRFHSQNPNQSLGLGLSIIKKIVEYYGYTISYIYENESHIMAIDFSAKN